MVGEGYSRYGPERDVPIAEYDRSEPSSGPREPPPIEDAGTRLRRLAEAVRNVGVSCREAADNIRRLTETLREDE